MARVIAYTVTIPQRLQVPEAPELRALVVIGCALALICAGRPLPF